MNTENFKKNFYSQLKVFTNFKTNTMVSTFNITQQLTVIRLLTLIACKFTCKNIKHL